MALLIITAERCTVMIVDSPMACIIVGQAFAHMAAVFCVPMGISA